MAYILLTNDDGVDSPALLPLARALRELGEVRVVVPAGERSWISKAISRFTHVGVERSEREGIELHVVDGSPADCANLGIHTLFDTRPAWVVAGVNIGLNTGAGFFLSSGTVGAASEGSLCGIPSLAFSVGVPGSDRDWKNDLDGRTRDGLWDRAAAISADVMATLLDAGFPSEADLISTNFPIDANVETPRHVTSLAAVSYDALFRADGPQRFVFSYRGLSSVSGAHLDGTDVGTIGKGCVSITPVRLAHGVELPADLRGRLERKA